MRFKDLQVELEYRGAPLLLKFMCEDFDKYSNEKFKIDPVLTRVKETIVGSSGVHEDYRGADFRDQHGGDFTYTPAQIEELLNFINTKYYRNDGKASMLHHSFQGMPFHFHLQIALLTKTYMPK